MSEHLFLEWAEHMAWQSKSVAQFRAPLASFVRYWKDSAEDFVAECAAPLLEKDEWRRIELVTEIDFNRVD